MFFTVFNEELIVFMSDGFTPLIIGSECFKQADVFHKFFNNPG